MAMASVTPVNLATNTAGASIGVGSDPTAIAITPNGQTAYVTSYSGTVTPIDIATNTAGTAISLNSPTYPDTYPKGIAITPDGEPVCGKWHRHGHPYRHRHQYGGESDRVEPDQCRP